MQAAGRRVVDAGTKAIDLLCGVPRLVSIDDAQPNPNPNPSQVQPGSYLFMDGDYGDNQEGRSLFGQSLMVHATVISADEVLLPSIPTTPSNLPYQPYLPHLQTFHTIHTYHTYHTYHACHTHHAGGG